MSQPSGERRWRRSGVWVRLLAGTLALVATGTVAACGGGAAPVAPPTGKSTEAQPAAPTAVPAAPTKAAAAPAAPTAAAAPAAIVPAKELTGAGATFPYPIYSKWFDVYNKKTGVKINYQSIGSGGGIKQLIEKTVDFGASDAPMKPEQIQQAGGGDVFHIPTVAGAVVVTYNLPGAPVGLKMTPEAVAGIFLGQIKKWNDPKIAAENPGVSLPGADIASVHRSDGSGTTNIFTDYLSNVSPEWKSKVGTGTSVNWPVGLGAKGNEGVAGQVKQTPNSVGYVELAYAVQNKLPYAYLKNQAGRFVEPTLESTTTAMAGKAASMPDHLRVSIVNPPGENSYPIAGLTWLLVHKEQRDGPKGKALVDFLWWGIHDGEQYAKDLLYAPLPAEVVKKAEVMVKAVTFQGKPLY